MKRTRHSLLAAFMTYRCSWRNPYLLQNKFNQKSKKFSIRQDSHLQAVLVGLVLMVNKNRWKTHLALAHTSVRRISCSSLPCRSVSFVHRNRAWTCHPPQCRGSSCAYSPGTISPCTPWWAASQCASSFSEASPTLRETAPSLLCAFSLPCFFVWPRDLSWLCLRYTNASFRVFGLSSRPSVGGSVF